MEIYIDELGLHIGSKLYSGDCIEDISDIGRSKFDCKVYKYPGGRKQLVYASQRVFRVPIPGMADSKPKHIYDAEEIVPRGDRVDNLLRAKKRINQIILCNSWDYFMSFTFDDLKVDASNIPLVIQKAQKWLNNQVTRRGIGYLLVPEYHKKHNRVHLHALITKLQGEGLNLVESGTFGVEGFDKPIKLSTIQRKHLQEKVLYPVYNVSDWHFGFSTAISTYGSVQKLANYVMKYITKDMQDSESSCIFGKYYWCSRNIQLYPEIELFNQKAFEFQECHSKLYYHRGSEASFKYVNRLGDNIEEAPD